MNKPDEMVGLVTLTSAISLKPLPHFLTEANNATQLRNSLSKFTLGQYEPPNTIQVARAVWSGHLIYVIKEEVKCGLRTREV